MNLCFYLILATSVFLLAQQVKCAKILGAFVFPGKSHFMMTKTVIKELISRGHEVTLMTAFPMGEKLPNYTEILIDPPYNFWKDIKEEFNTDDLFKLTDLTTKDFIRMVYFMGITSTEYALQQPKIQEIINDTKQEYDLLICEQFYQEAFLAFAYKYNIPVITMSTFGFQNYMSQMMGVIMPWSHVPHGFLAYDDKMNFYERAVNSMYCFMEDFERKFVYFPKQDRLVKKYFPQLDGHVPSISKMEKNISVMLLNSFFPLTTARPSVPGMIQVGGVHIKKPQPLPNDLKTFLDEAKYGAIYFSLGTNLRSSDMPPEKLAAFLKVFKNSKQRILWKWEDENIPELPNNVMVKKWMPQNDILAHENVKVFITHGGLFGTQEGVYHSVPMLGIPIYCDQHLNMNKATKAGYAISLYFQNITEASLTWALEELLNNPSYMETMQKTSQIFRDRPTSAMDATMYWIEYVIRYKGASHLRSSALDLSFISYYLLDLICLALVIVFLTLYVTFIIIKKLLGCFSTKNVKHHKIN